MVVFDTECVTTHKPLVPFQSTERLTIEDGGVVIEEHDSPTAQTVSGSSGESEVTNVPSKKRKISCCSDTADGDSSSVPTLTTDMESGTDDSEDDDSVLNIVTSHSKPPRRKKRSKWTHPSDLIVVLDLDECLIHFDPKKQNEWQFSACREDEDEDDDEDDSEENINSPLDEKEFMFVNESKVFLRPGLINFLQFVTKRFQTHIFTAGTKEYADAIVDQLCLLLKNRNAFSKRWYREDCETVEIWDPCTRFALDCIYVKPLSKVAEWAGRDATDLKRIVHIDDRVQNFLLNHENGIHISEWRADDSNDSDLTNVTKLLQDIDQNNVMDVRSHLRKSFTYPELQCNLDMMHFFSFKRKKGIDMKLYEKT